MHRKSFLKWAGGKSKSLPTISKYIGEVSDRLIEPFAGSCVVSLNIPAHSYVINDINTDLINLYKTLLRDDNFISDLEYYFQEGFNTKEKFYDLRQKFNDSKDVKERSLLFIYLNRHCFNGLCRYNKSNKFNVPYGNYRKVYFPIKELSYFKEKFLPKCEIHCKDFREIFKIPGNEDVLYCDPPYVALSETSNFTSYSKDGFSMKDHEDLSDLCYRAPCLTLISNNDTSVSRELYKKSDSIVTITVSRAISGNVEGRDKVNELLVFYNFEKRRMSYGPGIDNLLSS
jgi:DNA adenine methylase